MEPRRKLGLLAVTMASLVMVCWLGQAQASNTLFEWGLPVENLNGYPVTSYPERSNITPTLFYDPKPTTYQIPGDSFIIGNAGQTYRIETVTLWMLYGNQTSATDTTSVNTTSFPSLSLLVGPDGGSMNPVSTTLTKTRVWYSGGVNYERTTDGLWRAIFRLDFSVNFDANGGQKYDYFVNGLLPAGGTAYRTPSLLASNADLSGVTSVGVTDNTFLWYNTGSGIITSATAFPDNYFYNPADLNIQISGEQVPIPCTLLLLGSGLLGLGGWRRIRKN